MPETQLLKFRQQYPQYEKLTDAAVLTRIHQKHYSKFSYDEFVGKFEGKYGGKTPTQPQPDKSFLDVVYDRVAKEPLKIALDSPAAAGTELVGNAVDFIAQKLPTAALPFGSFTEGKDETFLQKLGRGKTPGEFVPEFVPVRTPVGTVSTDVVRPIVDFFGDIFWAAGPVLSIAKRLRAGTAVTKYDVGKVRKLLETVPEAKQLGGLSDDAILQVIKEGQIAEVGGAKVGKATTTPLKQITEGKTIFQHAEGIAKSHKKINALKEPKGVTKTKVTQGKFPKVEKVKESPLDEGLRIVKESKGKIESESLTARAYKLGVEARSNPELAKRIKQGQSQVKESISEIKSGGMVTYGEIQESYNVGMAGQYWNEAEQALKNVKQFQKGQKPLEKIAKPKVDVKIDKRAWTKHNLSDNEISLVQKDVQKNIDVLPEKIKNEIEGIKLYGSYLKDIKKSNDIDIHIKIKNQGSAKSNSDLYDAIEYAFDSKIRGKKLDILVEADNALGGKIKGIDLSGKDYTKGLFNAAKDDITSKSSGIISDPYRNVRKFLKENKLELTQDEMAKINNFARKLAKETLPEATRIKRFEEFIAKDFKKIKFETGVKPLEKIAKAVKKPIIELSPNEKFLKALKEVKPLRGKQERIYTQERGKKLGEVIETGKKVSGEQGFIQQKAKLKGEMTKVQFESLRDKIKQSDVDNLFTNIKDNTDLTEWEKITAGNGLSKMFGEVGGVVPTKGEIALLEKVFGKELANELSKKQGMFKKFKDIGFEIANIPRAFMTSFDLSMGLRQGIFAATGHPKIFFNAWKKQFRMFASEKYYQEMLKEIRNRPNYPAMEKSGLDLTDLGDIRGREEAFMSGLAEKINLPTGRKGARFTKGIGPGRVVRASGRAYTGLANRLRADLFDYFVKIGDDVGKGGDKIFLKDAAKFINNATGRGELPKFLEGSAIALNTVLFSPRLLFSRLNLLNPIKYIKLEPTVRKQAIKDLFKFVGAATVISGLAKMGGADVETDPRNANFAKIKVGNTRYDPLGGFQQPIRTAAQMMTETIISSTTGKAIPLGEGYKPTTVLDVAGRFLAMKEAPLASFAHGLIEGENAIGEKFDVSTEVANRFIPMVMQDMDDLYREKGIEGIPMATPAIFGVGVQTYGGVKTWGLDGKDYPKLNKELLRLKTTMGFPAKSAYGKEFDITEYNKFRRIAGKAIANKLNTLIGSGDYRSLSDEMKKEKIGRYIDREKKRIKKQFK